MPAKTKESAAAAGILTMRAGSGLPPWDDAAVLQENWGGPLALPARASSAVVDLRATEGRVVVPPDTDERDAFAQCIASVVQRPVEIDWRRSAAIIAPFRPMVHRNATPFLFPYAEDPRPFDARAEEEGARPAPVVSGKKNDAKAAAPPPAPLHVQFPEVVCVQDPKDLKDLKDPKDSKDLKDSKDHADGPSVVAAYRALRPLTQPYDATLEHSCAATPAEACGARYSTALRHRLREVHQLTRLPLPPPFVMAAFNSAVSAIAHAQKLVKPGEYLWELIYPHAPGTQHPVFNPNGKYVVRLYIDGAFRRVTVDDYFPVDALGRPLLSITSEKELWPAILAKAIFKALGPAAQHQLFTDPEAIVAALVGGWIPQYIDPRRDAAAACRALYSYQRLMQPLVSLTESPLFASPLSSEENCGNGLGPHDTLYRAHGEWPDNGEQPSFPDAAASTASIEGDPFQEQLPFAPPGVFVCGVAGMNTQRQLYAIREIALLQNTFALRVSTDPVEGGVLKSQILSHNTDIKDVEKELTAGSQNSNSSTEEKEDPCVWATLEELAACMSLVAFIPLGDANCALRHSTRLAAADESGGAAGAGGTTSAAAAAAAAAHRRRHGSSVLSSYLGTDARRDVVRWIHIHCERVEQIALVSVGTAVQPPPPASPSGVSTASSRPASSRSALAAQSPPPPTPPTTCVPKAVPQSMANKVVLELYTWSRGDPFSHMGTFMYETGRLSCNIYTVPVGSHILRVTAAGMEPQYAVTLLSTREFTVGDERDALRDAGVFRMSDAGMHDAIMRAGEEVVWFKRRISVKETTVASFIVVSLDHTVDLAAHRDVPPTLVKETKNTQVRATGSKGVAGVAKAGSLDDLPSMPCGMPIIQHCTLALMDLDTGATRTGAIGRLVKQVLEPNHNGYLIIAYAVIAPDEAGAPSPRTEVTVSTVTASEGGGGGGGGGGGSGGSGRISDIVSIPLEACETPMPSARIVSEDGTIVSPGANSASGAHAGSVALGSPRVPLCGRGLWKLTISADRSLDSYRNVPNCFSSFEEEGQLRRGSRALLFSYICTISEQTCFTLQLDLYSQDPMPFTVKIFRGNVGSAEASMPAVAPMYVSTPCTGHLFVPHVALDIVDKARSAAYTVEAWLDADRVALWEARRRHAQAVNFRAARAAAEAAAEAQRAADLAAHMSDPRGFAERLEQSVAALAESAESLPWRDSPGTSAKKLKGPQGGGGGDRRQRGGPTGGGAGAAGGGGTGPRGLSRRSSFTRSVAEAPAPAPLLLDATDAALAVRFAVRMDFSARVDVRAAAAVALTAEARDPIAALRAAFSPGDDPQAAPSAPRAAASGPAGPGAGGLAAAQRRGERAARDAKEAPEEAPRGDHGRASRQRFLDNPRGVLLPYLMPGEDVDAAGAAQRVVVTEVAEEPLSQHAPVLDPAAFRIAPSAAPPTQTQTQAQAQAQTHVPSQRAASGGVPSAAQRTKSPGERQAVRGAAGAAALLPSMGSGDEDPDGAEIRAPAAALAQRLAEELRREHDRRSAGRESLREAIREYWAARAPNSTLVSLLALYEEDPSKQRKNRSRVAN